MTGDLFLTIRNAEVLERVQRIDVDEATIGRTPTNVVYLPHSAVSRNHAVLVRTPTEFLIRDLGSHNGTRLNGQPILESVLPVAALVEIGPYQLQVFSDLGLAQAEANRAVDESTRNQSVPVRANDDRKRREQQLTPGQLRVYNELLGGRSEKEVAHELKISVHTVHSHSRAIYAKFEVASRAELLSWIAGHLAPPG
ncbi:MAG: FHA domain-containing protein [Planctomycetaceae bacterium]